MRKLSLVFCGCLLGLVALFAGPAIADGFDDRVSGVPSGNYAAGGTDVALLDGGTNASLTAVNGGVCYSSATALALTAAGTSGQILKSNGAAAPTWTTDIAVPAGGKIGAASGGSFSFSADSTIQLRNAAGTAQACLIYNLGQWIFRDSTCASPLGVTGAEIQALSGSTIKMDMVPTVGLRLASDHPIKWSSTTAAGGSADAGLDRSAAGTICPTGGSTTCAGKLQVGTSGAAIASVLSGTASLDFGATTGGTCDSLTVGVTGAADGDTVSIGVPNALAASDAADNFTGFVSSTGTVTVVRCCDLLVGNCSNPAAATVRATVTQF